MQEVIYDTCAHGLACTKNARITVTLGFFFERRKAKSVVSICSLSAIANQQHTRTLSTIVWPRNLKSFEDLKKKVLPNCKNTKGRNATRFVAFCFFVCVLKHVIVWKERKRYDRARERKGRRQRRGKKWEEPPLSKKGLSLLKGTSPYFGPIPFAQGRFNFKCSTPEVCVTRLLWPSSFQHHYLL